MRLDPRGEVGKFTDLLKTVEIPDIGFNEYVFSYQVGMADIERHRRLNTLILCPRRHVLPRPHGGLQTGLGQPVCEGRPRPARDRSRMDAASEDAAVQQDWAYTEPRACEWEEAAGDQPDILFGLGSQYYNLKRAGTTPFGASRRSPRCRATSRPTRRWPRCIRRKATSRTGRRRLEKAREMDDAARGSVQIDVDLANYYMSQKQWDKALPHVQAAAATWAGLGLLVLRIVTRGWATGSRPTLVRRRNATR